MELTMRPMLPEEQNYSYGQSQQLAMQTDFIGHLSGDIGDTQANLLSSWKEFRTKLNTDEFKMELETVLNALRDDERYGGILKDPIAYCNAHPESTFTDQNGTAVGFRADTEQHAYLLRLDPSKEENNITIFCHQSKWLDHNIEKAKAGIRFVGSKHNNKFRIADGDKIAVTIGYDGEKVERACRFIDETHLEVGIGGKADLYHINEFAERMEKYGNTYVPLASTKEKEQKKPSVTKQLADAKATSAPKPKDKAIEPDKGER